MTSLASQLKALQVPQTSVHQPQKKKRVSLLFDAKEAANLDNDSVYAIGVKGFDELCQIDTRFRSFERSLFSSNAKSTERSILSSEANEQINVQVNNFLCLLSPYFLIRPAHKAMEWLLYRFHIHEYNSDAVLACILPYHESNMFARGLQLLRGILKDPHHRWHWLRPLITKSLPLPKQDLIRQARKDSSVIKFVCKSYKAQLKIQKGESSGLQIWIGFYTWFTLGVLTSDERISDTRVHLLLPYLLKGLKSDNDDVVSSAYMILSVVFSRATLVQHFVEDLMLRIVQSFRESQLTDGICVLLLLLQTQPVGERFTKPVLMSLLRWESFGSRVTDLSHRCSAFALVRTLVREVAVLSGRTPAACKRIVGFISGVLRGLQVTSDEAATLISDFLKSSLKEWSKKDKSDNWDEILKLISSIARQLEALNTERFDQAIQQYLKLEDGKAMVVELVEQRVSQDPTGFLNLLHPVESVRVESLSNFLDSVQSGQIEDREFCRSTMLGRLRDESPKVLMTLLNKRKLLLCYLGLEELTPLLSAVLDRPVVKQKKHWNKVKVAALSIICSQSLEGEEKDKLVVSLLRYAFPLQEKHVEMAKVLRQSSLTRAHPLFQSWTVADDSDVSQWCYDTLQALSLHASSVPLDLWASAPPFEAALILCVSLTQTDKKVPVAETVFNCLQKLVSRKKLVVTEDTGNVDSESLNRWIEIHQEGKIPVGLIRYCIQQTVAQVPLPDNLENLQIWEDSQFLRLMTKVFGYLCAESVKEDVGSVYQELLIVMMKKCFPSSRLQLRFLTSIWIHCVDDTTQSYETMLRALKCTKSIINSEVLGLDEWVVPCLVAVAGSPVEAFRREAVACINQVGLSLSAHLKQQEGWLPLLSYLQERSQDITADHRQLPVNLSKFFGKRKSKKIEKCLFGIVTSRELPDFLQFAFLAALEQSNSEDILLELVQYFSNLDLSKLTIGQEKSYQAVVTKFTADAVECFTHTVCWEFFLTAVKDVNGSQKVAQAQALNQIKYGLYEALPAELQQQLLETLLELLCDCRCSQVAASIQNTLKHVTLQSDIFITELRPGLQTVPRKVGGIEHPVNSREWKRIIVLLELGQSKKKIKAMDKLVPILYELLQRVVSWEEQVQAEYVKQLLLSFIHHVMERTGATGGEDKVSILVRTVRCSSNPHTHHLALTLLALQAQHNPDTVLNNLMAIFTFMGSTVLRQDDAYSFQVIRRTVQTVLPALLGKLDEGKRDSICGVMKVFVDALPDIPEHRRSPLFLQLLDTLGPEEYLWVLLSALIESHVSGTRRLSNDTEEKGKLSGEVMFGLNLCHSFPAHVQLQACVRLLTFLNELPAEKEKEEDKSKKRTLWRRKKPKIEEEEQPDKAVLDISCLTSKQLRHFKFLSLGLITKLISSEGFLSQAAAEDEEELEPKYSSLLDMTLQYVMSVSACCTTSAAPNQRYWRAMLQRCHDLLEKINALLPVGTLLGAISNLLSHKLCSLRRKAMDILCQQLQNHADKFEESDHEQLLEMMQPLLDVKAESEQDLLLNKQVAMYAIKLLSRMLAAKHPQRFVSVLEAVCVELESTQDVTLKSSALLCVGELTSGLLLHSIVCINTLLPLVLRSLQEYKNEELVQVSGVTALHKIIGSVPQFISAYLQDILKVVCRLKGSSDSSVLNHRLSTISDTISTSLPIRVLLPAVDSTFPDLQNDSGVALSALFSIFSSHLSRQEKQDITAHTTQLTNFFLNALDYRQMHPEEDAAKVKAVESAVVDACMSLVLKLSEVTFRPLFFRLFSWATDKCGSLRRVLTFYRLSDSMADKLKSLFVLFAGHFLQHAAELLNNLHGSKGVDEEEEVSCELVCVVMDCLRKVCQYDSEGFINQERFRLIMQPLVDQIDNEMGTSWEDRVREHVIPCISQLTVAAGDDTSWKAIQYSILLKARHDKPQVRLLALATVRSMTEALGEAALPLLPEAVPFLAELLEDDSNEVEVECQKVIKDMEDILGEPLQKYF